MAKVLYTAEATVTGGRAAGHGRTNDGALDVQLRTPTEMGGDGGGMQRRRHADRERPRGPLTP